MSLTTTYHPRRAVGSETENARATLSGGRPSGNARSSRTVSSRSAGEIPFFCQEEGPGRLTIQLLATLRFRDHIPLGNAGQFALVVVLYSVRFDRLRFFTKHVCDTCSVL